MDPLSLSSTFMGLISLCYAYQANNDSTNLEGFLQWLYATQQADTARLIEQNESIQTQLNALMAGNHNEVMGKLEKLNNLILSIASRIEGLNGLANSFQLHPELSNQAIRIIKQLVDSGGEYIWITRYTDSIDYAIDTGEELDIDEPRFFEDDLNVMLSLGLITTDFIDKVDRKYRITRQAVRLVEIINARKS